MKSSLHISYRQNIRMWKSGPIASVINFKCGLFSYIDHPLHADHPDGIVVCFQFLSLNCHKHDTMDSVERKEGFVLKDLPDEHHHFR